MRWWLGCVSKPRAESIVETFGGAAVGTRAQGRKPRATTHRAGSGACLVRGRRRKYETATKGACSPLATLPPRTEGPRDEEPDPRRSTRWTTTPQRAPGSLKKESILVAATAFLFAEGVETGTLIGASCGRVLHPAEPRRIGDRGVLDEVGGGEPSLSLRRHCLRTGGSVLLSSLVDPRNAHHHRINHPRRNRRWNSGCRLARGATKSDGLWRSTSGRSCTVRERRLRCCVARSPASSSKDEEVIARRARRTSANGKRGLAQRREWQTTLPPRRTRGSDARVALARRSNRSRSRQLAVLTQRSGRFHFTSIWKRPGTGV